MNKIRFGIIGLGREGTKLATLLQQGKVDGAVLTALCDCNEAVLAKKRQALPGDIAYFTDFGDLIKSRQADAVIVATHHYAHVRYSKAALEAGLHVICEKPIGVYTKNVHPLIETARQSNLVFTMMFNQRTNPVFRRLHDMVQDGELGKLKRCVWIITNWYRPQAYYDMGGWRATWAGEGGGVLINQCPHNLDLWQWIVGMPETVWGKTGIGKYHDIEVEDDATAYMEYENGMTGLFVTSTGETPGTNRLELSGDLGKIVYEGGESFEYWRNAISEPEYSRTAVITEKSGFGRPDFEHSTVTVEGEETAYVGIMQNFVNAIDHGERLIAPGTEGIKSLELINAINLSSWTNKTVTLPIDEDLYYSLLQEKARQSSLPPDKDL